MRRARQLEQNFSLASRSQLHCVHRMGKFLGNFDHLPASPAHCSYFLSSFADTEGRIVDSTDRMSSPVISRSVPSRMLSKKTRAASSWQISVMSAPLKPLSYRPGRPDPRRRPEAGSQLKVEHPAAGLQLGQPHRRPWHRTGRAAGPPGRLPKARSSRP